jgi:hypothetical protein
MKIKLILLLPFLFFTLGVHCHGQNGPTVPSVILTWTQGVAPSGVTVTANCVYRSTGTGTTPTPPAIFCSTSPITTYTDTSVTVGTVYVYAVTARGSNNTESTYSATVTTPAIPSNVAAPTNPSEQSQ